MSGKKATRKRPAPPSGEGGKKRCVETSAMASLDEYLKRDPKYANWLIPGYALIMTNEALRPFVVNEISKFHQSIMKKLPPGVSCTGCNVNTVCPNGICDKIQREIEIEHWYPKPSFTNTCTRRWCTEPWEIAKCYMPPLKCYSSISASDADFTALINVIINCKRFQAYGTNDPKGTATDFSKARTFRNSVMHSSPQKVSENDMEENLYTLINILKMVSTPDNKDNAVKAIEDIEKLLETFATLAGMHELNEESMRIYLRALEEGKERLKHIRLMVVGMFGVGKTCLVRRLLNEEFGDVKRTEDFNQINVKMCKLNENDSWIKSERDLDSDINMRLNDLLPSTQLDEEDPKPYKSTKSEKPEKQAEDPHIRKYSPPKKMVNPGQSKEINEVEVIARLRNRKDGAGEKIIENVVSIVKGPKASGRKPTVSIWDFAGQSVYYSTHHFFLSSRSIYLLVLDISKGLDEQVDETNECYGFLQGSMKKYTCLDAFKFWVRSIYVYTQDEDKEKKYQPKIMLVATHGDKLPDEVRGKDKERQKEDYFEKALKSFRNTPILKMFHKKSFLVSCTEDEDRVFDDIKAEISKIAKGQDYWNEEIPAKWLPLERSIEAKKMSKNKLIYFNDVKEADAENELKLEVEDEIKLFLKIQHFLGNVMYFDANGLDNTVILDPQWIIDIFKLFVNHKPLLEIPVEIHDMWNEYKCNAKLTQPLLDFLIESAETEEGKQNMFKENRKQVIGYMEHLDVIAKLVDPEPKVIPKTTDPKPVEASEDEAFYFVPCMLKQLIVADEDEQVVVKQLLNLENPAKGISTPVLCFVFESKCLPPSIFHRLLATYIKEKPIRRKGTDYIIYNGFGAFKLDGMKTLCIWYADFIIYARVKLHDPQNGVLYTDDCIALRQELKDTLLSILLIDQKKHPQKRDVKGAFTEYIMCELLFKKSAMNVLQSRNLHGAKDGLTKVKDIKSQTFETCQCSISTDHTILSDEALKYWYEEPKHVRDISAWFKKEEEKDPRFLSKIPTPKDKEDFSGLSKYLPAVEDEFKELGKLLDVQSHAIDAIIESRCGASALIDKWTKKGKKENTWGLLKEKLYILKETYKGK